MSSVLESISLSTLASEVPTHPFVCIFGQEEGSRDSTLAKVVTSITPSTSTQYVFVLNPEHHGSAISESAIPRRVELLQDQIRGTSVVKMMSENLHDRAEQYRAYEASEEEIYIVTLADDLSEEFASILVIFDEGHGQTTFGDLCDLLDFLIQRNADGKQKYQRTCLILDDLTCVSNLNEIQADDLNRLLISMVNPVEREANRLTVVFAPELMFAQEERVQSVMNQVDATILADRPISFAGLSMWQKMYFQGFGVGRSVEDAVALFEEQALVIYHSSFGGNSSLQLQVLSC